MFVCFYCVDIYSDTKGVISKTVDAVAGIKAVGPCYASSHAIFSATDSRGEKSQFSLRISLRTQWKSLILLYINLWSLCLFNILYDERGSTLKLHSEVWQLSPGKVLVESDLGARLIIYFSWAPLLLERTTERYDLRLPENAIKIFLPFPTVYLCV